jgi:hypothetical protein
LEGRYAPIALLIFVLDYPFERLECTFRIVLLLSFGDIVLILQIRVFIRVVIARAVRILEILVECSVALKHQWFAVKTNLITVLHVIGIIIVHLVEQPGQFCHFLWRKKAYHGGQMELGENEACVTPCHELAD